jgi:PAS domain S-box-containing protein
MKLLNTYRLKNFCEETFWTITAFFLFVLIPYSACAENIQFNLDINLGVQITGIVQDKEGFFWISTSNGLKRYDGLDIKTWRKEKGGLSEDFIRAICNTEEALWLLTNTQGLNKFDKNTGDFKQYKFKPEEPNSLKGAGGFALLVDDGGFVWIGTENGVLSRLDPATETFMHFKHELENPNSLIKGMLTCIFQDSSGIFWIGSEGGGLSKFDFKSKKFTNFKHDPNNPFSISGNRINAIIEDDDSLWIGTAISGLNRFDKKSEKFIQYKHDQNKATSISHDSVMSLCNDGQFLWVGTIHGGLNRLNKETGNFSRFLNNPKEPGANKTIAIEEIFIDRSNILWVCSRPGAILKYDRKTKGFMLYRHDPAIKGTISSNTILPIYEDKQDTIWIGTGNAGLNQYLRSSDTFVTFKFDPEDPLSLPAPGVFAMAEDNNGTFWVSASDTSKGTLCIFDRKTGKFVKYYRHDPKNPDSISNNRFLLDIYPDRFNPDILWLAPAFGGLEKFDTKKEEFTHYPGIPDDPDKLSGGYVNIFQDDTGMLWLGGNYGLDLFEPSSEKVTRYRNIPDESNSLIENNVSVIYEDHAGILWLGTTGGLDKFNPKTRTFTHYTTKKGLPDNNILGILEDDHGNIWMSSGSGIIKFDPKKEEYKLYTKSDGLQGNAFYWFSDCRTRNGEMWFAGFNGVNRFNPDNIKDNPHIPNIALTSVKQGGEEIVSNIMPSRLKKIVLDWRTNYFEFEAAALEFTAPEKNKYMYMLEGIDDEWFDAGNRRFGRYSNIPGGTYTLKLKGSNNDGVWNEDGIAVRVIVANPPWKTRWAYALYFIVVATLLFGSLRHSRMKFYQEEKIAKGLRRSNEILNKEIMERQQAETDLLESERKYRDIIDSAPDLRYRMDMDGRIVFISRSVLSLSGYTVEEATGMKMAEEIYINPDERKNFLQTLQKNGSITDFEAQLKRKDGSIWWASTNAYFHKDEDGNPIGVEGVTRDITERKQAEMGLKKSEAKYRTLFENMAQGVFYQKPDGKIFDFNKNALDMFGLTSDQFLRKTSFDPSWRVINEDGMNSSGDQHPSIVALRTGKPVLDAIAGVFNPVKNDFVWLNINAIPQFKNGEPKPYQVFVTLHDITDLRKAESEIRQAHKMESIGILAGGIAHDFNNILSIIIGNAELALDDLSDWNPSYKNLKEIKIASLRAKDVVSQLLSFSRKTEQKQKPLDIKKVIKESIKLIRSSIPSSIEIHEEIPEKIDTILADATQIHQVLINLCTNASHAMLDDGGLLEIILCSKTLNKQTDKISKGLSPGNYIELIVKDSGSGIDLKIYDKIFDPYFTTKEVGKGTGMGLAVVHGIVKNHKGEIYVDSELGKGTTFTILFPAIAEQPQQNTEIKEVKSNPPGKETILFVDDEEVLVDMAKKILEKFGYTVQISTNPVKALAIFEADPSLFDLVISDMTMPQMSGVKLSEKLREIQNNIPIIICTGHSSLIDEEKAKDIGISAFAMKPITMSEIAKLIRNVLDK